MPHPKHTFFSKLKGQHHSQSHGLGIKYCWIFLAGVCPDRLPQRNSPDQTHFFSLLAPAVMDNIAGFLAYDVQASPPGLSPAPSGRLALWEALVVEAVQYRAAFKIQHVWRQKLERAVARALAEVARRDT